MDIIHRLNALASNEHDDLTIGFEAAATIIDLRLENKEQAQWKTAQVRPEQMQLTGARE